MASYNVDIGNTSEDGSVAIPDSNKLHEVTEGIYRKMYELAPEDIGGWVTSFDGGWGDLWTGKESAHNSMYQGYDGGEWKTKECPPGYTRSARIHLKNGDDTDDIWGDGDDEIKLSGVTRICARDRSDYDDVNLASCCLKGKPDGEKSCPVGYCRSVVNVNNSEIDEGRKMVPDQFKRTTTTGSSGTGAGTCETTISIDGGTVGDCYAINDKCNEFLKDKCISNIDVARKYNSNRSSMAPYCKLYSEIQPKYWNDNSDGLCGLKPESSTIADYLLNIQTEESKQEEIIGLLKNSACLSTYSSDLSNYKDDLDAICAEVYKKQSNYTVPQIAECTQKTSFDSSDKKNNITISSKGSDCDDGKLNETGWCPSNYVRKSTYTFSSKNKMRFQEIITKLPKILSADTRFPKEIEIYSSNNISDVAPEDSYTYKETFEPKLLESITSLINTGDITTNDSKDDVLSKLVTVKSLHDISNISGFHLKLKIISWTDKLSDIGNDTLKGIYGETSDTSGPVPSVRFDLIIGDLCIFKDDIKNSEEWVLTSFGEKLQDENDGAPDVCACNYPEEYQKWEIRRKLGLGVQILKLTLISKIHNAIIVSVLTMESKIHLKL